MKESTMFLVTLKASTTTDSVVTGSKTFATAKPVKAAVIQGYAKQFGIDVEVSVSQPIDIADDPQQAAAEMVEMFAAQAGGDDIAGAPVDPVRARVNELEHAVTKQGRTLERILALLEGGDTKKSADPEVRRGPAGVREVTDDDVDAEAPPSNVAAEAVKRGFPIVQPRARLGRREVLAEHASTQMSTVGPSAKSSVLEVVDGEIVERSLPKVGDSLRPLETQSDF